jgi:cob(I)alamin adenosyltransferase
MKIYTKTGDKGQTGLYGGARVPKSDVRLHAYGTIDELNSMIGVVCATDHAHPTGLKLSGLLEPIQNELFVVGSHISTPYAENTVPDSLPVFDAASTSRLEQDMDILTAQLPPLKSFILPGGSPIAAQLHLCRTICRRAERYVVELTQHAYVMPDILIYLNRLSDFFFTLARSANHAEGIADIPWKK